MLANLTPLTIVLCNGGHYTNSIIIPQENVCVSAGNCKTLLHTGTTITLQKLLIRLKYFYVYVLDYISQIHSEKNRFFAYVLILVLPVNHKQK